jgi:large repetitive protein
MKKILLKVFILLFVVTAGAIAQPQPPILIAPPNNATGISLFPTFDWTDVSGATSYRLQIFQGATTVFDQSNIPQSNFNLVSAVLVYNTTYYWRVNATGPTGTSNWSTQWFFTTANPPPSVPVLVSPVNGSVNVSLTPVLDWNNSVNANFYRVQVSTSSAFTTTVIDVSGLVNTGYVVQPGALNNNIMYYWRVRAEGPGGTSDWSTAWYFTTIPALPAAPLLLSPPNGSTNVSTTPTMDWGDVAGATSYRLQISFNTNFNALAIDQENINASQFVVPAGYLSGNTLYYWRVSASNVGGSGPWSLVWNFTTGIGAPAAPLLISPPNSSTGVSRNPTLDWNDVPNNNSYRVQVSTDPNFSSTIVNAVTGNVSQYLVATPTLDYNTVYYWRVNAQNAGGTGPWSQVWNFTTLISPPLAPTLILPVNNATNVSLTPYFDWTDVTGSSSYRLQIATNSTFSNLVVNTIIFNESEFTLPSGNLIGNTVYYWRVAGINSGGQGPYSSVFVFTTKQTFYLNLKVYLEGFYKGPGLHVRDTIRVYLANATTPFALKDSSLAYLDSNGTALISFEKAPNGVYYIIIKHRNHLETWSSNAMSFATGLTTNYDFTNLITKAYDNNMKQVGSAYVLYGGDANADGFVNPADYEVFKAQFGTDGYIQADFNGDTFADGYDTPIIYSNFGKSFARPY